MTIRSLIFSLFLAFTSLVQSQTLNYIKFNTSNGLPSSEVHDLYQDKRGYLWMATDRGLSRYDGVNFKNYGLDEGLPGIVVLDFFPQNDGTVWCYTLQNDFFKLHPESEKIELYPFNNLLKKYGARREIMSFREYPDKSVRVSLNNSQGFLEIQGNGEVTVEPQTKTLFEDNMLPTIETRGRYGVKVEGAGNESFFYMKEGQGGVEKAGDAFAKFPEIANRFDFWAFSNGTAEAIITNLTVHFFKDGKEMATAELESLGVEMGVVDGYYWVGTKNGAYFFNAKGEFQFKLLENYTVTCVLMDHEGSFWLSTRVGLFYCPNRDVRHFSFGENTAIVNMSEYEEDIWVNFQNGTSYRLHGMESEFVYRGTQKSAAQFEWNTSGAFFYWENVHFTLDRITEPKAEFYTPAYLRNLSDDPIERLIGVGSSRIYIIEDEMRYIDTISTESIYDASWIDSKRMWLGQRNGLMMYNDEEKTFTPHVSKELAVWISEIDYIEKNRYIVGTKERGVFLLSGEKDFTRLKMIDGLLSNSISEVYVQDENTYWVCSNAGLNRIRRKNGKYEVDAFTTEDGLTNNDVTDVLVRDDTVWLGTNSGLNYFPVRLMNKERPKTKVFLELLGTTVNDKIEQNLIDLSFKENKLDFFFKAISFRYKDRLRFRYKMIGLEEEWNYTEEQRVSYKSLPPGSFELIIQVGVDDFWYDEEIRKKIYIAQPYYATWQFILAIIAFSILIIYLFFRFRILSYNRYIIQEILRQIQRRLRMQDDTFIVRTDGSDVKVDSNQVFYAKAQGNYVELHTETGKLIIRAKISEFVNLVPDPNEYLQISRSTVVRKDKVTRKSKKLVVINEEEIKIGSTYKDVYDQLYL